MKLTDSQIRRILSKGETVKRVDGSTFKALFEVSKVEESGAISETFYITCPQNAVCLSEVLEIDGKDYKVAYCLDDRSGLIDAYLTMNGATHESKYL